MTKPGPGAGGRKTKPSSRPLHASRSALVPFRSAPFPYDGSVPSTGRPFLDIALEDRSGRFSARTGGVYWADETYSDSRVLLDLPQGFSVRRPGVLVVYLHGNGATLERDVRRRQQVPRQVAGAGLNSVLVAPQFAVDAMDSSAGAFWQPGAFAAFLDEAARNLARLYGDARATRYFRALPIVLVAYSGGYHPLAFILSHAGSGERIAGVIVLDGLYGDLDRFADWLAGPDRGFFLSAYSRSSADGNAELQRLLTERQIAFTDRLEAKLGPRDIVFLAAPATTVHADFVTKSWVDDPLRDVLRRVPGFNRREKP